MGPERMSSSRSWATRVVDIDVAAQVHDRGLRAGFDIDAGVYRKLDALGRGADGVEGGGRLE
jgi:hypothetical protein